jgi:hypothetical protein
MFRRLIQTVVAVVAVAAVASVAYGAIPSSNGTITACVDSKGAPKIIDAEAGVVCGAGKQTLTWNQQGPAGVSGRQVVAAESASSSLDYKQLQVNCPAGKVPVGGGGGVSGGFGFAPDEVAMHASAPSADGAGWFVTANETISTAVAWIVYARVICVTAS